MQIIYFSVHPILLTFAQVKLGCFFKSLSASCNTFLQFPESNRSTIIKKGWESLFASPQNHNHAILSLQTVKRTQTSLLYWISHRICSRQGCRRHVGFYCLRNIQSATVVEISQLTNWRSNETSFCRIW